MPDCEHIPEIYNLDVKHTNQEALKKEQKRERFFCLVGVKYFIDGLWCSLPFRS